MPFLKNSENRNMAYSQISLYPSQMDIVMRENCNQDCDYCWVKKSSPHTLDFESIKKGIDIFFNFPIQEQTITFTVTEPLTLPNLYQKTINYILQRGKVLKKEINIVTTTNGVNLNRGMRKFITRKMLAYPRFRLNISLDGKQRSHDKHRKLTGSSNISAFSLSWKNFNLLPKDKVRVILTVTPSEVNYLSGNIDFIFKNGFRNLDIFPQMFTIWSMSKLKKLKNKLNLLISRYINKDLKHNYNLRLLNRLWGPSHYAKLLLGSDRNFYLFEWILAIPYLERKRYIIGDVNVGIDLEKRLVLFNKLFKALEKEAKERCLGCNYRNLCAYPLPLILKYYNNRKDFNKYLINFCQIAKIFINLSKEVKDAARNELDTKKLF